MSTLATPTLPIATSDADTIEDRKRQAAWDAENRATLVGGLYTAFLETSPAVAVRTLAAPSFEPDPSWRLDQKRLDELSDGIDPDLRELFGRAVSEEHARFLQAQAMVTMERRKVLGSLGWAGTGLRIGAGVMDPGMLAIGTLSGGASYAMLGARATRIGRMVQHGLVAAIPMAGIEAMRMDEEPSLGPLDVVAASLSGFGMAAGGELAAGASRGVRAAAVGAGAAIPQVSVDTLNAAIGGEKTTSDIVMAGIQQLVFGSLTGAITPARRPLENMLRDAEYADVVASGAALTDKGKAYFKDQINPEARQEAVARPVADELASAHADLESLYTTSEVKGTEPPPSSVVEPPKNSAEPTTWAELLQLPPKELSDLAQRQKLEDNAIASQIIGRKYRGKAQDIADLEAKATPEQYQRLFQTLRGEAIEGVARAGAEAESLTPEDASFQLSFLLSKLPDKPLTFDEMLPSQREAVYAMRWLTRSAADRGMDTKAISESAVKQAAQRFRDPEDAAVVLGRYLSPENTQKPAQSGKALQPATPNVAAKPTGPSPIEQYTADIVGEPKIAMGAAAGASLTPPPPRGKIKAGDLDLSGVNDAPQKWARGSPTMGDAVSRSEVPSIRKISNALSPDPLLKSDGSPSVFTAPEWSDAKYNAHINALERRMDELYGDHIRARRQTSMEPMTRDEWHAEVTKAQRRGRIHQDPSIEQASQWISERTAELLELAQRHNVKGAAAIDPAEPYVPRVGVRTKIDAAKNTFGEKNLLITIANAIEKGTPGISRNAAEKLAIVWEGVIGKVHNGSDIVRGRILDFDQRETLIEQLKKQGLSQQQMDDILWEVSGKQNQDANLVPRVKRRIAMDETHSEQLIALDGSGIRRLAIEDLLENDAMVLQRTYAKQMIGASAMGEVFRIASKQGKAPIESIDQLIQSLERDALDLGLTTPDGTLTPKPAADLKKIETMARITQGIPLREDTATFKALRVIRGLNFIRLMANVGTGVQNAAEVVHSLSENGFRASLETIPSIKPIFESLRSGRVDNDLIREIELFGIATERRSFRVRPRSTVDDGTNAGLSKAETLIARAQRWAADLSLTAPGQEVIAKFTAMSVMNRWAWQAKNGSLPRIKRIRAMGIETEADARAILDQINTHALTERGIIGPKMVRLNLDQWDPAVASQFMAAVTKTTNRIVLRNNPAAYAKWMTHPMGQVVAQLRTFAFGAHRNKLLFELQQRDRISAQNLVVGTLAAGLVYAARTYVESLARDDGDEYRRDRLSPKKIAAASFSRAAWSSMLPTAIDTVVADIGQRQPVFSFSRTTGLEGGALLGNPTFDWANGVARAIGSLQAPFASDYDFSKEDVRNWMKAAFIPNIAGVKSIIEHLTKKLPDKSLPRE